MQSTHPFSRIQVQILNLAVLEVARQAHAVVRQMRLLANDGHVVLSSLGVVLEQFFAAARSEMVCLQANSSEYSHKSDAHHAQSYHDHSLPARAIHGAVCMAQSLCRQGQTILLGADGLAVAHCELDAP